MKHAVSLALLLTLVAAGCAGVKAREHALWPTVASTWPAIHEDIQVGMEGVSASPAVSSAINQVDGAVRANDYTLLVGVNWFTLEPIAKRGVQVRVDSNEISEGVAVSFLERIRVFTEAMQELTR